eukprot:636707-Heterocapsa_arctica.AAC.1
MPRVKLSALRTAGALQARSCHTCLLAFPTLPQAARARRLRLTAEPKGLQAPPPSLHGNLAAAAVGVFTRCGSLARRRKGRHTSAAQLPAWRGSSGEPGGQVLLHFSIRPSGRETKGSQGEAQLSEQQPLHRKEARTGCTLGSGPRGGSLRAVVEDSELRSSLTGPGWSAAMQA